MSSRKKRRGYEPVHPEVEPDGFDELEKELFAGPEKADTKTIQLCRQVEEAISSALVCSTSPLLRDLYVAGVEPLRGAALLRVLVSMEGAQNDYEQTIKALDRALGYFRGEVARAINRKRVPTLQFAVVPSDDGDWDEEVGDD